ncbi:MAG: hypothetical protein OXC19_02345 [Bryobacterales bacterium]|nr:hypothetical protein [Bryobacterales bacterium]
MTPRLFHPGTCLVLASWLAGTLPAETVELLYAPSDGAVFDVSETTERQVAGTNRDTVTDSRTRLSRVRVERLDEGFSNRTTILSVTLLRNGSNVSSPVFSAMSNLELDYRLDDEGNLVGITGYDQLPAATRATLPESLAKTLTGLLDYTSIQRAEENAYRRIYGALPGRSLETGVAVASAATHVLPFGGSLPLYAVDILERRTDAAETLKLTRRYHTDPVALAGEFEAIAESDLLATANGLQTMVPEGQSAVSVQGSVETLLDSDGLLVASQTATLEYNLSLSQSSGDPVEVQVRETGRFSVKAAENQIASQSGE